MNSHSPNDKTSKMWPMLNANNVLWQNSSYLKNPFSHLLSWDREHIREGVYFQLLLSKGLNREKGLIELY